MKIVKVAVGIVENKQGEVLIASRPVPESTSEIVWEFPGGKIESGETPEQALVREFDEEVGLTIESSQARFLMQLTIPSQYPPYDRQIHLTVYCVDCYQGDAHGREGQQVRWIAKDQLPQVEMLKANRMIIETLLS